MVGCDGSYNIDNFREACKVGWKVANAPDYFGNGGTIVQPNADRWVDTTWDLGGHETSLENWSDNAKIDCQNSGSWDGPCQYSNCTWISTLKRDSDTMCQLSFMNKHYGASYGCHCIGGNPNTNYRGVICSKSKEL